MRYLWTSADAVRATGGKTTAEWNAARVVIDSRMVQRGDVFVAIKGENFDGHDFVQSALQQGASAAIVSHLPQGEGIYLVVLDTLKALEDLGRYNRARTKARVIGLTGSVGKTSVKEMLRLALAAHSETFASYGNFNNHIGTPLNLANLPPDAKFSVFEMGMNHAGEISALTRMVQPDIALITNVEAVHLEFFKNVAAIADAKCEIFEGLSANGVAILNADNALVEHCMQVAKHKNVKNSISFGRAAKADIRLLSCKVENTGTHIEVEIAKKKYAFTLKAIGEHWAYAALAALAVTHSLKLDVEKTICAIEHFSEPQGRGGICEITVEGGMATLMDDSYNASPASMKAAFAKAGALQGYGRKIAVLGEMRELGESAPQLHAELADSLIAAGFDKVFAAWPLMHHLYKKLPQALQGAHAQNADALLPLVQKALLPNDLVLVKGSHGSKMYQLAEHLKTLENSHAL